MVTLTTTGGQSVLVNPAQVSTVRDFARDEKPTKVIMANGQDFEVEQSFDEVVGLLGMS